MKTCYSYIRFSSAKQARGGSERRQLEAARQYCREHGLTLDDSLRDRGVSGYRGKNVDKGALGRFFTAIEDGRVKPGSVLLVESLDRLSRQTVRIAAERFLSIINAGIEIVTMFDGRVYNQENIDRSWTDLIIALSIQARSTEESQTKEHRAKAFWKQGRTDALASGTPITGKSPGWIRYDKAADKFTLDTERIEIVRRMIQLAMEGHGAVGIARRFNQDSTPLINKRRGVRAWSPTTVQYILRSRTLIGEVKFKDGTSVANYYPKAVTEKAFYRLQSVMDSRKQNVRGRPSPTVHNIFGRILFSGADGGHLAVTQKHKGRLRLVSRKALNGEVSQTSFPYPEFERNFLAWIRGIELDETKPRETLESADIAAELEDVRRRVKQVQDSLVGGKAEDFPRRLELLTTLEATEQGLSAKLTASKQQETKPSYVSTHGELVRLIDRIATGEPDVRTRIRSQIHQLVKKVSLWAFGNSFHRCGVVKVELQDGATKYFAIRIRRETPTVSLRFNNVTKFDPEKMAKRTIEVVDKTEFAPALDCKRID